MRLLSRFKKPASPENGLYRVRYVDLSGIERTMTARPGGASRMHDGRWIPVWVLEPSNQLGHPVGSIREVLSYERIGR